MSGDRLASGTAIRIISLTEQNPLGERDPALLWPLPADVRALTRVPAADRTPELDGLAAKGEVLRQVCAAVQAGEPRARITCTIRKLPRQNSAKAPISTGMPPLAA